MKMTATAVRHKNTFLLIGGTHGVSPVGFNEHLNTIIKYESGTGVWKTLQQTVKNKNAGYVRMMVKSILFPSCAIGK